MKIKRDRILVVTLILLWAYFSFQSWIGSSEYWPVTLSGYWKDWDRAPSLIYKPVFHLVLTPLYFFNLDSVTHLQWAKGLFTFIGGTSLFLLYRILRHHLELLISLLIWGLVLFSQLGFSQLGKIRSDLLSFFFFLFGYLLLVIHEKKKLISTLILLVFFEMLMILTTPKAFLFPLALATICLSINRVNFRHWFWTHVGLFALAIITLLLVTIVRGDFYFYDALQTLFIVSRDSVSTQTSAIDGRFLRLSENAPLVLTVLSLIFFSIRKKLNISKISFLFIALLTSAVLCSLFLIRPLLPFYLLVNLVLVLILFLPTLQSLPKAWLALLLVISLGIFCRDFRHTFFSSNADQLIAIRKIESELKKIKKIKIFDGLGILPRVPNTLSYMGPSDSLSVQWAQTELIQNQPEFVIFTSRISLLSTPALNFLQINYRSVGPGYWLRNDIKENIQLQELPVAIHLFSLEPFN